MESPSFIRNTIISKLSSGPRKVSDIVFEVSLEKRTTVQGVYKALRILRKEEVITIHRRTVSLSIIWIMEQIETLEKTAKAYELNTYLQELQAGNRRHLQFTFTTLRELDIFWTHSFLVVQETIPITHISYVIAPHDWFMYSHTSTDNAWIKKHVKKRRVSRHILTHILPLDKKVTKERIKMFGKDFEYVFNENPLKQKENEYYNIIDSWIFYAIFDSKINKRLSSFIEKHQTLSFTKADKEEIESIMNERGTFTLTISKSEKKSSAIKKKILKYFE